MGLLWFATPTNLNHKFVNNGTKIEKFREIADHAIELSCNIVFDKAHTQEHCLYGQRRCHCAEPKKRTGN